MQHQRVLGIYAHPDDADVGAGGTLAKFAESGAQVDVVVVTRGDAGGFEPEGQENISSVREQEQRAAAAALGVGTVSFLEGYADGDVRVTKDLVRDIVAKIREYQPTLILTMSPEHNWDSVAASHPDHRAVGEATIQAVYPAARNPFAFPELLEAGLEPCTVQEVWLQGHQHPNSYEELSEVQLEKKRRAIRCHESQFRDMEEIDRYVVSHAKADAKSGGLGDDSFAEAFFKYRTA